jgi:GT2 family glycosyltransferase
MKQAQTGIVITQWRDPETATLCLEHVAALRPLPRMVVVVDNESDAHTLEAQTSKFPDVRFIALQTNTGHANAVNLGVTHLHENGCTYALLLDNDAFVAPEALGILEAAMQGDPDAGAASPLILSGRRPGLIWYGGGKISFLGNGVHEQMWKRAGGLGATSRDVAFVTGCAMIVSCAAFAGVGGFDASLITYADDLDFSLRLQRAGYRLLFIPAARVTHGESVNVIRVAGKPFRDYYTMRNRLLMIRRHGTRFQRVAGIPATIFWHGGVYSCMFLARGEWRRAIALARGVRDFFMLRTGRGPY